MGPAVTRDSDPRTRGSEAPTLVPYQDLYVWRKAVEEWVDLVTTAANQSSDRHFKTVRATMGRQLYRALPLSHRSVVDEAQARGIINFRQEDQLKAVEELVKLLATDPPMAIVSRLITTFNKVVLCKRKPNESLKVFVTRFWGLAADHLMHAGASSSSQTAEMLAIILLNNASLQDETLTAAKLELIRVAESRQCDSGSTKEGISSSDIRDIEADVTSLHKWVVSEHNKLVNKIKSIGQTSSSHASSLKSSRKELQKVHEDMSSLKLKISSLYLKIPTAHPSSINAKLAGHRLEFRLDDAVHVLNSLEQSAPRLDPPTSGEIQAMVDTQIQRALLSSGRDSEQEDRANANLSSGNKNRSRSNMKKRKRNPQSQETRAGPAKVPRFSGPDGQLVCYDCGVPGHRHGDTACKSPSWISLQRRSNDNKDEVPRQFFQQGHGK
jgi:hypothetical protein